jgi:hypothetical protein
MSPQLAPSGGWGMSAIPPLSGDKQTSDKRAKNGAIDPLPTFEFMRCGYDRLAHSERPPSRSRLDDGGVFPFDRRL